MNCHVCEGRLRRNRPGAINYVCSVHSSGPNLNDDVRSFASTIDTTIHNRGKTYGKFSDQAQISLNLKTTMAGTPNWLKLEPDQREALEMVAVKISRILNGDPNFFDSWHDISGYAELVADRLVNLLPK